MIKAIIFDLDGVLIDSEGLWRKAAEKYFRSIGIKLPQGKAFGRFASQYLSGRKLNDIAGIFQKKLHVKNSHKQITDGLIKMVLKLFDRHLKLNPGALKLIKTLNKGKYPLLLASSSPRRVINYTLNRFRLHKYFAGVVSGDNVRKGKPHPEIFLKGAKLLKTQPRDIAVVEDSISGIRAASRAGMKCIALKQPHTEKKYTKTASLIVNKLSQITIDKIKNL
ncbi:MAG: HAD family phosphatase [Patescibacteria group bacterium]|jgi:HAD superfamily hydrolase (TIGR01509 family)